MDTPDTNGIVPIDAALEFAEPAWKQIEAGRFQPRRIRGSFRGRELG